MKAIKENSKKLIIVVFAILFAVLLVFNFLTPMAGDDFAHYYGMTGEHCTTVSEIVRDMAILRNETNGRVIAHFFVYFFLLMPKFVFNIINAAVCTLFVYLAFRFFREEGSDFKNLMLLLCFLSLWWIFAPSFGKVYLWLTGACNYLWGIVLDLLIIYPFFCEYTGRKFKANKALLCICAFAAGAYSENGAVATIAVMGLLSLAVWIKNKKIPVFDLVLCIIAFGGFVFLMSAPSEIGGKSSESASFMANALQVLRLVKKYCLVIYLVYAIVLVTGICLKVDKRVILTSVFLFFAGILSIFVFVFAIYVPPRSFNISVLFTTVGVLILLKEIWDLKVKWVTMAACISCLAFIPFFISGAGDILSLHLQSRNRENTISAAVASGSDEVTLRRYASRTMYTDVIIENELEESPDSWYNDLLAKYYGLKSVRGDIS